MHVCADAENALQELRKRGLSAASKKASRSATEGLVGMVSTADAVAIVEINSETDFVARNELFTETVSRAAKAVLMSEVAPKENAGIAMDDLASIKMDDGSSIGDAVAQVAGNVRENIKLRRGYKLKASEGVVGCYLHAGSGPDVGRIAAAVVLESTSGKMIPDEHAESIKSVCHKLAMHVVGAVPKHLGKENVPQSEIDAEKDLLLEQAMKTGKPQNIVEKMVAGRLKKYFEEVCLLDQPFVMEEKMSVSSVVDEMNRKFGSDLHISKFVRVQVGEGMEKTDKGKDFAEEVAETLSAST